MRGKWKRSQEKGGQSRKRREESSKSRPELGSISRAHDHPGARAPGTQGAGRAASGDPNPQAHLIIPTPSQSLQCPQDPWEDLEKLPGGLPRFTEPPFMARSSCPQGVEGQSPSSGEINHSNRSVTRAPSTGQLMKAGIHRHRPVPRLTQGPGYPPGREPLVFQVLSGCPITASGALGPPRGLAKPRPGPANSPLLGETHSSASPFLCALFFVLLKFSPSCRGSPPPPRPWKGAEGVGSY